MVIDIGLIAGSIGVGFALTIVVWFAVWGITKVINLFRSIVTV
jgi:hypothetical protein